MKNCTIVNSFFTREKDLDQLEIQTIEDGIGDLYKKTFSIPIESSFEILQNHFLDFKVDMNKYSKNPIAKLPNDKGYSPLLKGQRLLIELLGPYNGPVQVTESSKLNLKLQTLENHPKTGHIEFSIEESNPNLFKIDTYSRSKDYLFHFARSKTNLVSKVQDSVWIDLCIHFKSIIENRKSSEISKEIVNKNSRRISHIDFPNK